MKPYLSDPDFTLYNGDVLDVLRELPDESADCCVTSPPFFGLRDYGVDGQIGLEATLEEWAQKLTAVFGRRAIGIELNPDYCAMAAKRLSQLSLLTEAV